ncbi:MAG: RNA polymerase sigma factor [Gemmataceae bacterium]
MSRHESRADNAARSDSSLFKHVLNGDQQAATELYYRYAQRLGKLVEAKTSHALKRRFEAEDIVQSVFASFFRGMGLKYYDVPTGGELWGLFLVIALNKIRAKAVYSQAAKRDSRRTVGGELLERIPEGTDRTASQLLELAIVETLDGLKPIEGEIVTLRIQGHEVAEIAAQVNRSKRTVERVLQGFRKKLAETLDVEDGG